MLSKFFNLVKNQDKIGEPPWNYDFLYYLNEKEYHKYLEKIYYVKTGKKIDKAFMKLKTPNLSGVGIFQGSNLILEAV